MVHNNKHTVMYIHADEEPVELEFTGDAPMVKGSNSDDTRVTSQALAVSTHHSHWAKPGVSTCRIGVKYLL